MYEFHGWFGLAESTEESDAGNLDELVNDVLARVDSLRWPTCRIEISILNGQHFLSVDGLVNRRRSEASELDKLLRFIAQRLPGSWGMLYERADDMPTPPGPGAFRVRVVARGQVREHLDPFLSPTRPTIED